MHINRVNKSISLLLTLPIDRSKLFTNGTEAIYKIKKFKIETTLGVNAEFYLQFRQ